MERLMMLGTGNALTTKCYNTCYLIENQNQYIMVDAGGGNGILAQMQKLNLEFGDVRHLIVTHEHCDHVLGVVWVIRKIATLMKQDNYQGEFHIWCHDKLDGIIRQLTDLTLQKKFVSLIDDRIIIHVVQDGENASLLNHSVTFFDIHSTKAKQYGFKIQDEEKQLVYLGDEPLNQKCVDYLKNIKWLVCEAFCLYSQREIFKPYEKHHATVKDACELAEKYQVPHMVLVHTEDKNYENRKDLYIEEGKTYYHGDLNIPYDLERIEL